MKVLLQTGPLKLKFPFLLLPSSAHVTGGNLHTHGLLQWAAGEAARTKASLYIYCPRKHILVLHPEPQFQQ